jgi:molecular chaperone DnaK (HSP70)
MEGANESSRRAKAQSMRSTDARFMPSRLGSPVIPHQRDLHAQMVELDSGFNDDVNRSTQPCDAYLTQEGTKETDIREIDGVVRAAFMKAASECTNEPGNFDDDRPMGPRNHHVCAGPGR